MHIYENYYAKTQLYTKLRAHDINDLYDLILQEIEYLFKVYDRQEWKREFYRHPAKGNMDVRKKLQSKFGIDLRLPTGDRKSTRLNSSHVRISYAVFCLKKKTNALVAFAQTNATRTKSTRIAIPCLTLRRYPINSVYPGSSGINRTSPQCQLRQDFQRLRAIYWKNTKVSLVVDDLVHQLARDAFFFY